MTQTRKLDEHDFQAMNKKPAYLSALTALGFIIFGAIPWIIGWWAIVMLILGNL